MTRGLTITRQVHFRSARRGRKVIHEGPRKEAPDLGSVPRISRLMALAIHMDELVRAGEVADYSELARLAHVTRARMTQIMSLLHLAPDIQEEILWLPLSRGGRDPIREKAVRALAAEPAWGRQRRGWAALARSAERFEERSGRPSAGTLDPSDEGSVQAPAGTPGLVR